MKNIILCSCLSCFALFAIAQTNDSSKPYPGGSGKYMKLVWSDEFNGEGLPDNARWNYETGYLRNRELQYYTKARKENAYVKNGSLVITAHLDFAQIDGGVYPITSACLNTQNKGDWKYGRIEVRAKVPLCLGTWPAIWMMPTKETYGGWPQSGEIDIMEYVGYEPDKVYFNLHTEKYNHTKGTGRGSSVDCSDAHEVFHVYAVEWFVDHIDWYMDDKKVFSVKNDEPGWEAWPLDHSFYLILNFAFGGDWGANKGVDVKALPKEFLIDYVRIFQ